MSNLIQNKKNNDTIDLAKFIGSIMVFAMHVGAFGSFGKFDFIWQLLTRWVVPFFFITSSFFLFSKIEKCESEDEKRKGIKKYCLRIFYLYIAWFIYNIPSIFFSRFYTVGMKDPSTWLTFIKRIFLCSTFMGSWYLVSSIFCALVIFLLSKKLKTRYIILIAFVFEAIGIMTSAYYGLVPPAAKNVLDFLMFPLNIFGGLLYFSIGKWIAENIEIIKSISVRKSTAAAALFYIMYFIEITLAQKASVCNMTDKAFMLIPISICIVIICLNKQTELKSARKLRKYSIIIYCAQGNILLISEVPDKLLGIHFSLVKLLVGAVLTVIVIIVINYLQKTKYKCFRYFT